MIKALCPKCGKELKREGGSFVCENGHTYDLAKEGYVNLLLANKKNSKNPGDNKLMAAARDKFLSGGSYDFLAERLAGVISEIKGTREIKLLDCGCGSGYYLRRILRLGRLDAAGVDISKEAVKIAAKQDKTSFYAVASVYELPFEDECFDVAVCVFSPYAFSEYARVLKRGGRLIVVYPAEKHLLEIKRKLYKDSVYENDKAVTSPLFDLASEEVITDKFYAGGDDLKALLEMTPYFYRTRPEEIENICAAGKMEITASFKIANFTKK